MNIKSLDARILLGDKCLETLIKITLKNSAMADILKYYPNRRLVQGM